MMKRCLRYMACGLGVGIMVMIGACSRKNEAKERVQAQREAWEASLPDSIKAIESQADSLRNEIEVMNHRFDAMIHTFTYVENPREVEGYYMNSVWAKNYPLNKTGLVARLSKSENLELIAALSGGAHFDRIRVEANGKTAQTSTVAYDQALNYRMAGLNIVCFSDSAANSCASLIAENNDGNVKIVYLEGDKVSGVCSYPKQDQSIMTSTWDLFETRRTISRDERMIPLLAHKAAIIQTKIDELKTKD